MAESGLVRRDWRLGVESVAATAACELENCQRDDGAEDAQELRDVY
jgi:hypothetical protein